MNLVNVGYASTNYYVLVQTNIKLLIDVGWPGTLPKLLAKLKRQDVSFQDIRYLLVTHYHPDHAGLAQEMKDKGVCLIVLEQQLEAIPVLKTYMKPINPYVDITLQDNLRLTTGTSRAFLRSIGIAGEILSTPGHSDDSVTLVLDDGVAFTGDLPSPASIDQAAYETVIRSWSSILSLKAKLICPGHGPVCPLSTSLA